MKNKKGGANKIKDNNEIYIGLNDNQRKELQNEINIIDEKIESVDPNWFDNAKENDDYKVVFYTGYIPENLADNIIPEDNLYSINTFMRITKNLILEQMNKQINANNIQHEDILMLYPPDASDNFTKDDFIKALLWTGAELNF